MSNWNLDDLYQGFNEKYLKDIETLKEQMLSFQQLVSQMQAMKPVAFLEAYLTSQEETTKLARSLSAFASLTMSTDVTNQEALGYLSKLQQIYSSVTKENVMVSRYIATLDLKELSNHSEIIKTYLFQLNEEKESARHLLSEKEEVLYAKLRPLSSGSWSQLQGLLTSNLNVKMGDKEITLSEVRNLAYDNDKDIRKNAYEAELKAYDQIDDAVALALSNIKREVTEMNTLRGYDSALEKTLISSRMQKETLDAMIDAMKDYRQHFERYLKAKATYLGYENGLPFYELFAPVGKLDKNYTYEEAKAIVNESFYGFSKRLGDYSTRAFNENWIDVYPKKGKRGGAFCSNQQQIKQSRILTNFTGSLSDVSTIAHELGHGYHGDVISDEKPLNWGYPMPLAETASIFCETIVTNNLLSKLSNDDEILSVLEIALQGDTQVIIDILSRYFFETKLFENSTGPISKNQMKTWMVEAQKEAYLEGLDHENLHPYMWLNKGHYYSAGLNFYNFPYAFGLLFGKGLYAKYLENKDDFLRNYDKLLMLTGKASVEDVAMSMGIDVKDKSFWHQSLNEVVKDIDKVISLFQKK
ncbi:MAG: M3 family oligoendopeptidase [Paracholeplasma sp.]|nr:M3 family oligoendopeptidase [Paracholeplasma sp.]MDY3195282.1 M3 family oligoendopeptidase [Paracholeplasma sp.]